MGRKTKRPEQNLQCAFGFTLIEVIFAIIIFAGSLIVLLGLQSSSIQRTLQDRNRQQGMLVARQILAALESNQKEPEIGEQQGGALDILEDILPGSVNKDEAGQIGPQYQASVKVTYWPLPNIDPEAVKRIDVTVSWGDGPREFLEVTYFIATEPP